MDKGPCNVGNVTNVHAYLVMLHCSIKCPILTLELHPPALQPELTVDYKVLE
jgi:hypothetical protein